MSSIRVLTGLQAVRIRPSMYAGGGTGFDLLLSVLISLSDPVNEELPGKVHIQFLSDGSYRLACDLALLPSRTAEYMGVEQPVAIPIVLCLHVPGYGFLGYLPVINALSDYMKIVSTEGGLSTTVETSRGGLIAPLSSTKSSEPGTILEFLPDSSVLEVQERPFCQILFEIPSPEELLRQLPENLEVPFELSCEGISEKMNEVKFS